MQQKRKWGNIALRDKANRILREIESVGNIAQLGKYLELNSYKYYEFEPNASNNSIKGAVDRDKKSIYINADLSTNDKHFTLAHEIAHSILHPNEKYIDYRRSPQPKDPIESEANVLAYELVMPLKRFKVAYKQYLGSVEELSRLFFVPEIQVEKRIEFLEKQIKENKIDGFMGL